MPRLVTLLGKPDADAARLFAVFRQDTKNESHVHVGDVHAPDAEMALVLAKEQFTRREPCVNLWVVPYTAIAATSYHCPYQSEAGSVIESNRADPRAARSSRTSAV